MKAFKAKEPVRIRFKKLKDGNQSIYLDIYLNGKRKYEFLKLYLIPETNALAKAQNATSMRAAVAIKSRRIDEIIKNKAGITAPDGREKMRVTEWLQFYSQKRESEGVKHYSQQILALIKKIKEYSETVRLEDVDKEYILGLQEFLIKSPRRFGGNLKKRTVQRYIDVFRSAIGRAFRDGIIEKDPFTRISSRERIHASESSREFLTDKEVKKLINQECGNSEVKRAFLFSCFCGLRYSDIIALKWDEISIDAKGRYTAILQMKKTGNQIYLPLGKEALRWMLNTTKNDERIFHLPSSSVVFRDIKKWVASAGITKNVSFHTARHTFATLELTYGADLYTVSKLLGHTNIATTQIYAKIIDKKKEAAVDLLDNEDWG